MATMSFKEQYLHPNWQRKRLEVMEDAGFQCENCGDADTTLNVHHKKYVKGRMVWEYGRDELQCLCETCHKAEHQARDTLGKILDTGYVQTQQVAAIVAGFVEGQLGLPEGFDVSSFRDGPFSYEFDIGILASVLIGLMPDALLRALEASGEKRLTPPQEQSVELWRRFVAGMERFDSERGGG